VEQRFSDFRLYIGAGAHSGATAADFNRVPVLTIPEQKHPRTCNRNIPFQRTNTLLPNSKAQIK
jgi:hypothetical protein